jgi:hypothetical protein
MPDAAQRQRAALALDQFGDDVIDTAVKACALLTPWPRLTNLAIVAGALGSSTVGWTTLRAGYLVDVLATTDPDWTSAGRIIDWDTDGATVAPWRRQVPRDAVGDFVVGATLNNPRLHVQVSVYDLTAVAANLPLDHGGNTHVKGYAGFIPGNTATLTATTDPDLPAVWAHLTWSNGATGHTCAADVSAPGDQTLTVTLGTPAIGEIQKSITLHICQWPRLQIKWEEFNSDDILNDGVAEIDEVFDARWEEGRPDARAGMLAHLPTDQVQAPLCYSAGETIHLQAGFRVTRKSTDDEAVQIEGRATIDGVNMVWAGTVQVLSTDNVGDEVDFAATAANHALTVDKVQCEDAFQIAWFMKDADNATWISCGQTDHQLYVTHDDATENIYWTLLDISCRGANGLSTDDMIVDAAFIPFTAETGDANGFRRLGDNVKLRYYGEGCNTAQGDTVQTPRGILSNATGSGRCGGWARLMVHMLALHGIDAELYTIDCSNLPPDTVLHVRNLVHNGAGTSTEIPYTHTAAECTKNPGLPGQGKTNPQFCFGDHAAVWYDNQIYDPSYGVGPEADQARYERDAVAGIGDLAVGDFNFNDGDGTPQFMAEACCEGFFVTDMPAVGTLDTVAAPYGRTGNDLWNHPYNRDTRAAGANPPPAGTILFIPRSWAPNDLMLEHGTMAP